MKRPPAASTALPMPTCVAGRTVLISTKSLPATSPASSPAGPC
jgi:hypothetical protein